MLNLLHVYTST